MDWLAYWTGTGLTAISLVVVLMLAWWALRAVEEYRAYVFALRRQVGAMELELVAMRRRKTCPACLGMRTVTPRLGPSSVTLTQEKSGSTTRSTPR